MTVALSAMWRKISCHIIIGQGVKEKISEPGVASIASAVKTISDPSKVLSALRRNPYICGEIYPSLVKFNSEKNGKKMPALVSVDEVVTVPLGQLVGEFRGKTVNFNCLGNSYEADARKLAPQSYSLRDIPEAILSDPIEVTRWLAQHHISIARECGKDGYSIVYLMEALQSRAVISLDQRFLRAAAAKDLYDKSKILQNIPGSVIQNPVKLRSFLLSQQNSIEQETSRKNTDLGSLLLALQVEGIVSQEYTAQRLADAENIYKNSAILQNIPQSVLSDTISLFDFLVLNRPAILLEVPKGTNISLKTLIMALKSADKVPSGQTIERMAGAREIYEKSATLKNIPNALLGDIFKLLDWLQINRNLICSEASYFGFLAISTLTAALQSAGRLPINQIVIRLASGRDLYEKSTTLKSITGSILSNPIELAEWLYSHRDAVGFEAGKAKNIPLVNMVLALQSAGKIVFDQNFNRMAAARDLYERSSALQQVPAAIVSDPILLIEWLYTNRKVICAESSEKPDLALVSMIQALESVRIIPVDQMYHRLAGGRGIYDRSQLLQQIPASILRNPARLIDWLFLHKGQIEKEAAVDGTLAISTLVQALCSARVISDEQKYQRLASGRDLYEKSATLQSAPQSILMDKHALIDWLLTNRIIIETESNGDHLALATLTCALESAGKIPDDQGYQRLAGARDYYDFNPVLQSGPAQFPSIDQIVIFIDDNKTRIPKRNNAEARMAYSSIVDSLEIAHRIDRTVNLRVLGDEVSAADYCRTFEQMIKREIIHAINKYFQHIGVVSNFNPQTNRKWTRFIDRSVFLSRRTGLLLSERYVRRIIKWALKFYGFQTASNRISQTIQGIP